MTGKANSGNRTGRRGRKHLRRPQLTEEAASALRALWRYRQQAHPHEDEEGTVNAVILEAWQEVEAEIVPADETEDAPALHGPRGLFAVAAEVVAEMGGADTLAAKEEPPIII